MDAEEDGAGPSVVVVESDSAGPSATVTEVRNMVVLESKSERSRRLATLRKRKHCASCMLLDACAAGLRHLPSVPSQRIGGAGARHDAHAYS